MSEIETSPEAVERTATVLRMNGHHDKAAFLCTLAAERDALAARLALAEGMAEALEPMARVSEVYPNARPEADVLNVHDARCVVTMADLQRARTALAAWRAAAAKEVGDGERETTSFQPQDFRRGYNDGFRGALLRAAEVIRRQRVERGRSDVNAIKAITAILELDNG